MSFIGPPPFHTARLTVRGIQEADLADLMAVNADDAVTQYLPYASWQSLDDARAWYHRMQGMQAGGSCLQFVLIERTTGKAIGTALLFRYEPGSARAEIGYVLGRAYWGTGLMEEALRGLIACAFNSLGLRRLEAEVNPANQASCRLLQRLGFVTEGVLRQRWVDKGETYDVAVFGLLRHEFTQAPVPPNDNAPMPTTQDSRSAHGPRTDR